MSGQDTEMPGAGAGTADIPVALSLTPTELAKMIASAIDKVLAEKAAAEMAVQLAAVNMGSDAGPSSSKSSIDPKVVDRMVPFLPTKDSVQRWGTDARNMLALAGQNVDAVATYLLSGMNKVFDASTRTSIKLQMQTQAGCKSWDATVSKVTWALLIESMAAAQLGALRNDPEVFIALSSLKGLATRVGVLAALEQLAVMMAHLSQQALAELDTAQALADGLKSAYLLQLFPVSMHPILQMGENSVAITDFASLYKRVVANHVMFQAKLDELHTHKPRTAPASDAGPSTSSWKDVAARGGSGRAGKRGVDGSDASAPKRPRDTTQALPSDGPLPTSSTHPKEAWMVLFPQMTAEERQRIRKARACFVCGKQHPTVQGYPACPEFAAAFRAGRVVYKPWPKN